MDEFRSQKSSMHCSATARQTNYELAELAGLSRRNARGGARRSKRTA